MRPEHFEVRTERAAIYARVLVLNVTPRQAEDLGNAHPRGQGDQSNQT